jgi:hypothetical protein
MYFLSRSELFRFIGLDTDKFFLVLGPDEGFREWIDIGIGTKTTTCEVIPASGIFDVILCVSEVGDVERTRMKGLLAPGGTIWELRKGEIPLGATWKPFDADRVLIRTV